MAILKLFAVNENKAVLGPTSGTMGFLTFGVGGWLGVRLTKTEDSLAYVIRDTRLCLDLPLAGLKWYYESFLLEMNLSLKSYR